MDTKKNLPKLKLSLKKETLRPLSDRELYMLDSVVGGTGCDNSNGGGGTGGGGTGGGCGNTCNGTFSGGYVVLQ